MPTTEFIRSEGMGGGVGGMVYSVKDDGNGGDSIISSHANHRGDVIARSNESRSLISFALYEAYGTRPYEWGDDPDRQKANTKEEESDLGLLNEGMRFRDLETGVFLTRDPIGYADGPNVYCYVHCNPITHFDPLGLGDYMAWCAGYGAFGSASEKAYVNVHIKKGYDDGKEGPRGELKIINDAKGTEVLLRGDIFANDKGTSIMGGELKFEASVDDDKFKTGIKAKGHVYQQEDSVRTEDGLFQGKSTLRVLGAQAGAEMTMSASSVQADVSAVLKAEIITEKVEGQAGNIRGTAEGGLGAGGSLGGGINFSKLSDFPWIKKSKFSVYSLLGGGVGVERTEEELVKEDDESLTETESNPSNSDEQ